MIPRPCSSNMTSGSRGFPPGMTASPGRVLVEADGLLEDVVRAMLPEADGVPSADRGGGRAHRREAKTGAGRLAETKLGNPWCRHPGRPQFDDVAALERLRALHATAGVVVMLLARLALHRQRLVAGRRSGPCRRTGRGRCRRPWPGVAGAARIAPGLRRRWPRRRAACAPARTRPTPPGRGGALRRADGQRRPRRHDRAALRLADRPAAGQDGDDHADRQLADLQVRLAAAHRRARRARTSCS